MLELSKLTGKSVRALNDWERERYFMSVQIAKKLSLKSGVAMPKNVKTRDPFWYTSEGGRIAGKLIYEKYGIIGGDPEKRKGKWLQWWKKTGQFERNSITVAKTIKKPPHSRKLAEFAGIEMGDGGITKYQIKITTNARDDFEYAHYIKNLIESLFRVPVRLSRVPDTLAMNIVVSRRELVLFCKKIGLKIGNKLNQGLDIPSWIKGNGGYEKSCLRGLVDTDGCIFDERHKINGKFYSYKRLNLTSYSRALRKSVFSIFKKLGMHPKIRGNKCVQLENIQEIRKYFRVVGTHNPKHLRRFMEGSDNGYSTGLENRNP